MGFFDGIANFFGGGTPPAYQTPQNIKDFMQPIQTTELQKVAAYQNLLKNKQDYDTAQNSMDLIQNALQTPDVGEDMRNKWRQQLADYEQARNSAAQAAESTRKSAAALGIDVSDYGSDKSLQESEQALRNYKNVGVQNFLNLPTLDELEENRYRELRSQGASPGMANRILNRERDGMRDLLSKKYTDAMTTYGTNPDGSIDQGIGMQLLRGLAKVDPVTAQMFYGGFATPGKVYDANQQRNTQLDVASLNNAAALERVMANINANWRNAEAQRETQKTLLDWSLDSREKEAQLDRDLQWQMKTLDFVSRGINGTNKNNLSPFMQSVEDLKTVYGFYKDGATEEEKSEALSQAVTGAMKKHYKDEFNGGITAFTEDLQTGLAMGLTPQEALEYAQSRRGWNPDKNSKAQGIFNQFDVMFDNVIQGNIDEAGKMFQALDENAEINQDEFFKQFNKDELPKYKALSDAYKKYFDVGRNAETADEKTLADAKDNLIASVRAVKRGTTASDELAAMKNARATERRTHGEEKPADNSVAKANQNVRALLGDNNSTNGNTQSAQNVTPQIGGAGYPYTRPPTDNFFGIRYGNYYR